MKLPSLIPLLLILSLISFTHAALTKYTCPNNPKTSSRCSKEDKPVCGYFREQCPEGNCPKTFPNKYSACQDDTTNYYTHGACPSDTISCAVVLLPNPCDNSVNPVCANVNGKPTTFENLCVACGEAASSLIKPGPCQADPKNFCENIDDDCNNENTDPVCGYFREGCPEGYCARTFNGACAACQEDDTIVFYESGACDQEDEVLNCAAASFPPDCPEDGNPVCADLVDDCPDSGCATTFPNFCVQCQNAASSFAKPGACANSRNIFLDPLNRPDNCDDEESDPVCGYFKEGCPQGLCPRTYDNACLARQDEDVIVYQEGSCAQDTISCAVVSLPVECPNDVDPVCTGSEPTTYDNLCKACKADASSLIKPGACRA